MSNYCDLNHVFRALADPMRRHIVELLCDDEASVSFIAEPLPISLVSVLNHLQALEKSGLVRTHKIGRVRTCWVEPRALRLLDQWVNEHLSRCQRRPSRS